MRYGNRETQRELGLNFLSSRYETQKRFFKWKIRDTCLQLKKFIERSGYIRDMEIARPNGIKG